MNALKVTFILLCMLCCASIRAQTSGFDVKSIVENLDSLSQRRPVEKIYIHTDRENYSIGDTIWFKSYLFEGGYLNASKKSDLLYLELIDDSSEVVRRISIKVKDGTGYAQIPLIKEIFHEGGYVIRAYTNWMKNFLNDGMFSKRFYLGTTNPNKFLISMECHSREIGKKDMVSVKLNLRDSENMPAGLRRVKIEIKDEEDTRHFFKEMETDLYGNLEFSFDLDDRVNANRLRLELQDLRPGSGYLRQSMPLFINRPSKIDLQFLPEGGNLVAGLSNLVAFKAISENGKGIPVSGKVYDKLHNAVCSFKSIHLGMGSFLFTPKTGESYSAELDTPMGATTIYKIPQVQAEGTVLRVTDNSRESDSLRVEISASATIKNSGKPFFLIASTRGIAWYAQKVDWSKSGISIAKKLFPTGIARLSLLQEQAPVNERMVYIDHSDSLRVSIHPDKITYVKRDSVSLTIKVLDDSGQPVAGNFSLAVTDDSQVNADTLGNSSIMTSILLNSDLKGRIEDPGQYTRVKNEQVWKALDHLLLTQGWVGYDWADVFNSQKEPEFEPERLNRLSGAVRRYNGQPIPGAPVVLKIDKPFQLLTTVTDQDGKFAFNRLPETDTLSYFIQARAPKGKILRFGNVFVNEFLSLQFTDTIGSRLRPDYVNANPDYINYLKNITKKLSPEFIPNGGTTLKEVRVTSRKINYHGFNLNGHGQADIVLEKSDLNVSATEGLYDLLRQKLPGLRYKYNYTEVIGNNGYCLALGPKMLEIAIDGEAPILYLTKTPQGLKEFLNRTKIARLSSVEIMYTQKYLWKYLPPAVAKQFTAGERARIFEEYALNNMIPPTGEVKEYAIVQITTSLKAGYHSEIDGTYKARRLPVMIPKAFYSPKYLTSADNGVPDLRATLYWNPEIITDQNGLAAVSFYTSDTTGTYTMILNGTDFNGGLGVVATKFSVGK